MVKSLRPVVIAIALLPLAGARLAAQSPSDTLVVAESAVDQRPTLVAGSCQNPVYPVLLRSARIEGRVVLQFVVDTLGRVEPTSITTLQSAHRQFDESARRALVTCRYRPARAANHAVRVMVQTPFTFALASR